MCVLAHWRKGLIRKVIIHRRLERYACLKSFPRKIIFLEKLTALSIKKKKEEKERKKERKKKKKEGRALRRRLEEDRRGYKKSKKDWTGYGGAQSAVNNTTSGMRRE